MLILRQTHTVKAKKSYGQHFLTNEHYAQRIADSLSADGGYTSLIEVGPGQGMLTKYLTDKGFDFKVVEADADMVVFLHRHFPGLHGRIIGADFLRIKLEEHFSGQVAIIGNFPYNISSQILIKAVDNRSLVPELVGMFQKEVAERVTAAPGSKAYGVISLLVQAWFHTEYLFSVSAGNFKPPPKVQSAVIRLQRRTEFPVAEVDEALFRLVVKTAFGQRRKMLRNTLKPLLPDADPMLEEPFFTRRPEQLSLAEFVDLVQRIKPRLRN
jgi:16S rRNA (adenine1518-N6/adenine1519-N6)-dimethyltransferase